MSFRDYYHSDDGRWLEITCGTVSAGISILIASLAGFILTRSPASLGVVTVVTGLALVAWGMGYLAVRLLRGPGRGRAVLPRCVVR